MRILVVKLSSFGDVIHTLPALTHAAAAVPGIEIDWLVDAAFAEIAAAHPAVTKVFPLALRRLRWPPTRWPALIAACLSLRAGFAERRYDLVIDAQGLMKSALLARLGGARIIGLGPGSAREPAASRLYGRRVEIDRSLHAVERVRRLFAAALGYPPPVQAGSFGLRASAFAASDLPPGLPARFGVIVASASWPTKLWPEERWRALMSEIAARGETVALPWGNDAERARAQALAAGNSAAIVLPERLEGARLLRLLAVATWAVGLDSGLMHLAAALGVPGVWLYGPTDPKLTGPYGADQIVVRSTHADAPCLQRRCTRSPDGLCCMRGVGLDAVTAACRKLASG